MPACAYCGLPTEKLKCSKCRSVVYCNVTCQKADWEEHKTSCEPCVIYVTDQMSALHKLHKWRKLLLKWSSYLNPLLEVANEDGQRILLTIFKEANQMGSNTTNDPVYSSNNIPILQKLIVLYEQDKCFEAQGKLLCEMGQSFHFLDNDKEEMACYRRANEIGDTHGIAGVKCVGNLGVCLVRYVGCECMRSLGYVGLRSGLLVSV